MFTHKGASVNRRSQPWERICKVLRVGLWLIGLLVISPMGPSAAHEGHRPLPTRGLEVDVGTGKLILTRAARSILDVETVELAPQTITHITGAYGALVSPWQRHALISSLLPGRIVDLHVVSGERVRQGQVLAELESPELERLQLELRTASIERDLSIQLTDSTGAASRTGSIPGIKFIEAQTKLKQAEAALDIAAAKWLGLHLPQSKLDAILQDPHQEHRQRLELVSPMDGVIAHTEVSIGKIVNSNEHLFEVLDLSTLWLKIELLEKDLSVVRKGQPLELELTAQPGTKVIGEIDVVDSFLDPVTHLGTAWATLINSSSDNPILRPGMTGRVRIHAVQPEQRLVVPLSSVIRDGAERFVLVEQEQTLLASTYQKQAVVLGERSGDALEVRGGEVFPGDRVVTRGSHELGGFFAKGILKVSPQTAQDIGLLVQPAVRQRVAETISIDGVLDIPPTHRTATATPFGGSIERILIDRGQQVKRGDVLAEIVSQEFQNLQLELLRVALDASFQQTTVENYRSALGGVSARQLWEAESQLYQTISRREMLHRQLASAGLSADQLEQLVSTRKVIATLPIIAPIDGRIVGFDKFLGYLIRPEESLFTIHNLDQGWVQGFISERDLPQVRIGQEVRVRFVTAPNEVLRGTLARSGQAVSDIDRTLTVWIELQEIPSFAIQHNMLARVTIETGEVSERLAVPRQAVVFEGTRAYVFVQRDDQSFERRLVTTSASDDNVIAISDGLKEGELLAVRGALALQSGYAALR